MDILSRLMKFRDYTELSNSQFADKAGIPRPTLSQFLNGRNKRLSDELASKLHGAFPNLNMMWLLFGEGNMLDDSNIEISEGKNDEKQTFAPYSNPENQTYRDMPTLPLLDEDPEPIRKKPTAGSRKVIEDSSKQPFEAMASALSQNEDNKNKKVKYIMVFYTDHSADVFTPS